MTATPPTMMYGQPHTGSWITPQQVMPVPQYGPSYPLAAVTTLPVSIKNDTKILRFRAICVLA